jgi:hypothetical protein
MTSSMAPLVLFHTAQSNVDLFSGLLVDLAPDVPVRHIVRDDLLKAAFSAGRLTSEIRLETAKLLSKAAGQDAGLVVCTCSTLGPGADDAQAISNRDGSAPVLRIDRPMAEDAVMRADNIVVAAAFSTTLDPTMALVETAARMAGRSPKIVPCLIENGTALFEAGDMEAYQEAIARGLEIVARTTELIVLAQASMLGALDCLPVPLPVPVLSSPASGIEVAIEQWRQRIEPSPRPFKNS